MATFAVSRVGEVLKFDQMMPYAANVQPSVSLAVRPVRENPNLSG